MVNRDMRSMKKFALLITIAVHRVIQEVATNARVVEQCVALAGCSVPHDRPALSLPLDQKFQQFPLCLYHPLLEAGIAFNTCKASRDFTRMQFFDAITDWLGPILRMARVNPQRTPVGGQLLNVKDREPVSRKDLFRRNK